LPEVSVGTCARCGATFNRPPSSLARVTSNYCSSACRVADTGAARQAKMIEARRGKKPHNFARVELACLECGKHFAVPPCLAESRKFCSKACSYVRRSTHKPVRHFLQTIGGESRYRHIRVAEELLGRSLTPTEVVHHVDGKAGDDSPANLVVLERTQHTSIHSIQRHHSCHFSAEDLLRRFPNAIWLGQLADRLAVGGLPVTLKLLDKQDAAPL
jgi:endogenous inhibitor of DNA gyrase (YacG/DUF329 family)